MLNFIRMRDDIDEYAFQYNHEEHRIELTHGFHHALEEAFSLISIELFDDTLLENIPQVIEEADELDYDLEMTESELFHHIRSRYPFIEITSDVMLIVRDYMRKRLLKRCVRLAHELAPSITQDTFYDRLYEPIENDLIHNDDDARGFIYDIIEAINGAP
jgi:hypothetical protein